MNKFTLVNCDTDSITICREDGSPISAEENEALIKALNATFPPEIVWTDDGAFSSVIVLKAKNYVLYDGEKKKIKGSALRGSTREKALAEFIGRFIDHLLFDKFDDLVPLYQSYAKEILNIEDITRWSSKKSLTEKVYEAAATTQKKILEAIKGSNYRPGDKAFFYFDNNKNLKLQEHWQKDHDPVVMLKKLFNTIEIFDSIINTEHFPNYSLKKHKDLLSKI